MTADDVGRVLAAGAVAAQLGTAFLLSDEAGSSPVHRAALQDLSRDPKINLEARIPHGEGQTYLREILLVADHTAYHIGELVVVRRLLGAWPPARNAKA